MPYIPRSSAATNAPKDPQYHVRIYLQMRIVHVFGETRKDTRVSFNHFSSFQNLVERTSRLPSLATRDGTTARRE